MGGANAPANFLCVGRCSSITGANRSSPAVAKTESAKPASRDCHGSASTTAAMAKPKAGKESVLRFVAYAESSTAAIAAARKTEGDGRTSAIKQVKATAVAIILCELRRIKNCMHHKTKLETIAKFAPLTATKCVSPDLFI